MKPIKNFTFQSQQFKLQGELDMSGNALAYASLYTINWWIIE